MLLKNLVLIPIEDEILRLDLSTSIAFLSSLLIVPLEETYYLILIAASPSFLSNAAALKPTNLFLA